MLERLFITFYKSINQWNGKLYLFTCIIQLMFSSQIESINQNNKITNKNENVYSRRASWNRIRANFSKPLIVSLIGWNVHILLLFPSPLSQGYMVRTPGWILCSFFFLSVGITSNISLQYSFHMFPSCISFIYFHQVSSRLGRSAENGQEMVVYLGCLGCYWLIWLLSWKMFSC